ncbi:hypothetical protein ABPG73_006302 [Tetrahymena malaccensis]
MYSKQLVFHSYQEFRDSNLSSHNNIQICHDNIYSPILETQNLFQDLAKCIALQNLQLTLSGNQINDLGAIYMGRALAKLKCLFNLTLNLRGNKIGKQGGLGLYDGIKVLPNLIKLSIDLRYNSYDLYGIRNLEAKFKKIKRLTIKKIQI